MCIDSSPVMDFPSAHFPCTYSHVSRGPWTRRQMFHYGGYINVDVDEQLTVGSGQLHCVSQKSCPVTQHYLCTRGPCLPLSLTPEHVGPDWEDGVSNNVRRTRALANTLINKVRFNSGRMKNASMTQYHLNLMEVGGHMGEERQEVRGHSSLHTCSSAYSALQDDSKYLRVNSAYTGGCICTLAVLSSFYLIYAAGQHRNKLCVHEVRRAAWREEEGQEEEEEEEGQEEYLLEGQLLHQVSLPEPARQIHASYVNNVGYCCVRTVRSYSLYEIARDGEIVDPVCVYSNDSSEDTVTSITSSPYINGEVLMATETGCVRLTDSNNSTETLLQDEGPRFEVKDLWRQVHWGAHPRQFLLADRTCLQIFDARTKYGEGVDLFAQPSAMLHQEERLMVTHPLPELPYLHVLATDFSLMMLDQRLPKYPVMLWRHTLDSAPQYLCPVQVDRGYTQVLLASQLPPTETHCYTLHTSSHRPVRSHGTPFRLAAVRDMAKSSSVFVEPSLHQDRLNPSLVGVSGCQLNGRLLAFQLSSYGEVFYQTVTRPSTPPAPGEEREGGRQPERRGGVRSECELRVIDTWLSRLNQSVQNTSLAQHISPIDVHDKLAEVRHPHVLCMLCQPLPQTLAPVPPLSQKDRLTTCNNCGHSLQLGQLIYADKAVVEKNTSVHEDLFDASVPKLTDMHGSSANSRLLTSLWREQPDIHQLLQDRNKERQALQEKRKQRKAEKLARRKSERVKEVSVVDEILAEKRTHRVVHQDSPTHPHLEQRLGNVQMSSSGEGNVSSDEDVFEAGLNVADSSSWSESDGDMQVEAQSVLHPDSTHSSCSENTSVSVEEMDRSAPVSPHRSDSSAPVTPHRKNTSAPVTPNRGETSSTVYPHRREASAPVTPHRREASAPVTPHRRETPSTVYPHRGDTSVPVTLDRLDAFAPPAPHSSDKSVKNFAPHMKNIPPHLSLFRGNTPPRVAHFPSTPASAQSDQDEDDLFFTQESLEMFSTPGSASLKESDFVLPSTMDSPNPSPDKKKRTVPGF